MYTSPCTVTGSKRTTIVLDACCTCAYITTVRVCTLPPVYKCLQCAQCVHTVHECLRAPSANHHNEKTTTQMITIDTVHNVSCGPREHRSQPLVFKGLYTRCSAIEDPLTPQESEIFTSLHPRVLRLGRHQTADFPSLHAG